jgi:hypothetical protein
MKTQNTLENKAKFFAQYYSQNISYVKIEDAEDRGPFEIDFKDWRVRHEDSYLQLKPLSKISDEESIELALINESLGDNKNIEDLINHSKKIIIPMISFAGINSIHADYLRSKGYPVPWMGLSVDDLIEYGWIKI